MDSNVNCKHKVCPHYGAVLQKAHNSNSNSSLGSISMQGLDVILMVNYLRLYVVNVSFVSPFFTITRYHTWQYSLFNYQKHLYHIYIYTVYDTCSGFSPFAVLRESDGGFHLAGCLRYKTQHEVEPSEGRSSLNSIKSNPLQITCI